MEAKTLDSQFLKSLLRFQKYPLWIDYDEDVDVLYISFEKPQKADDTVLGKDGNLYNYRKKELVGITVLNAKKFKSK